MKWLALPLLALTLAACSSAPKKSSPPPSSSSSETGRRTHPVAPTQATAAGCTQKYSPAQEDLSKRGDYKAGGLYAPHIPDTTPDHIPDVDCIAEPLVTNEPPSAIGNRSPYSVLGKKYEVMQRVDGYVEQGTASYYGNKFHGRRTSNQEVYDMYAFTAAHKTLPLPSFARVTNLDNGKSVVVRVNDRGPFHEGRVIDLSYAAAVKLGITQRGTGNVEVRALTSADRENVLASAPAPVKTTVATGKPMAVQNRPPASAPVASAPVPREVARAVPPAIARPTLAPAPSDGDVQLQVASFASRENADRALARLSAAGIARASLSDVASNGRTLWRLRVNAADQAAATELAGRIAGLGFGQPQLVRE